MDFFKVQMNEDHSNRLKTIEYCKHVVISNYNYKNVYDELVLMDEMITLEDYKLQILHSYKMAEKHFGLKILYSNDTTIVTSCPRYLGSLETLFKSLSKEESVSTWKNVEDKIIDLIQYQIENNINHGDFAFRNICYDEKMDLHLIDFEDLFENDWKNERYSKLRAFILPIIKDVEKLFGYSQLDEFEERVYSKFNC